MRISKNGKNITVPREEFEAIVRHLKQFEKIVKELERQEKDDELSPQWAKPWQSLKEFLLSEELEGSEDDETDTIDGRYCCHLYDREGRTVDCINYHTWRIFAEVGCAADYLLGGGVVAQTGLSRGRCRRQRDCPQYRP